MTTMDTIPSFREYAGMKLVSIARNRKRQRESTLSAGNSLQAIVRVVLHLAGFALLTIGAFQFNIIAGYAMAGISCFVMATLMTSDQTSEPKTGRAPDLRTGR